MSTRPLFHYQSWTWVVALVVLCAAAFLRLDRLDQLPPAPYWEEVALGYDAYSIAQTGRDHHGHWLPLVAFESFGDWKPGGYIYSLVPLISWFGLSVWTLRLPAALAGVLIVGGVGELTRILLVQGVSSTLPHNKLKQKWVPLISMAVAAISPWLILFSRAAWEVNLAACLILWAVIFGLKVVTAQTKNWWQLPLAAGLLVLSMYTYHSARIVAPFLGLALVGVWLSYDSSWRHFIQTKWRPILVTGGVAALLLLPLIMSFGSPQTSQRFAETSIFSNVEIINESNQRIEVAGGSMISRVLYHRWILFGREITNNFLSHFRLDFLFLTGDQNARHSTQFIGQLYHVELLFLLLGMYALGKNWNRVHVFLLFWLVLGIFPASITYASPHALRILPVVPVIMYVLGLGIWQAITILKRGSRFILIAVLLIYVLEFSMFWRFYTSVYPKLYSSDWLYGYEEVVTKVEAYRQLQPDLPIVMTRKFGRPAMYYWFYTQADPQRVQALDSTVPKDQGEFLNYETLSFVRGVGDIPSEPSLLVVPTEEMEELYQKFSPTDLEVKDGIRDLAGKDIWNIVKLK
jgi:hypothetical protein